jgi:hypothetical protein
VNPASSLAARPTEILGRTLVVGEQLAVEHEMHARVTAPRTRMVESVPDAAAGSENVTAAAVFSAMMRAIAKASSRAPARCPLPRQTWRTC